MTKRTSVFCLYIIWYYKGKDRLKRGRKGISPHIYIYEPLIIFKSPMKRIYVIKKRRTDCRAEGESCSLSAETSGKITALVASVASVRKAANINFIRDMVCPITPPRIGPCTKDNLPVGSLVKAHLNLWPCKTGFPASSSGLTNIKRYIVIIVILHSPNENEIFSPVVTVR